MLVLCLTAGVFITPRPPENEMFSFCLIYCYGGTMHVLVKNKGLALNYSE